MRGLIVALLILLAGVTPAAQEPAASQLPTIVTGGQSLVSRAPDQAFVIVAVETRAKIPRDAQSQNATAMTAVQQRITATGVAKDGLRTQGYSIQQEFDFVNGRRVPRTSPATPSGAAGHRRARRRRDRRSRAGGGHLGEQHPIRSEGSRRRGT